MKGKEGKIIAIDYFAEMLKKAKEKINQHNWHNITLLERDVSDFELDQKVDAVLCTGSIVSISDYEKALKKSVEVLKNGCKYVVLGFQLMWGIKGLILNPFYKIIFKATGQDVTRKPWKDMKNYLRDVKKENYSGFPTSCYMVIGKKGNNPLLEFYDFGLGWGFKLNHQTALSLLENSNTQG